MSKTVVPTLNFGDWSIFVAGTSMPDGKYAIELTVCHEPAKAGAPPNPNARIGCMLIGHPLDGGEVKTRFLSFGTTVHESWKPSTDGLSVEVIEGGKGVMTLPTTSNWAVFLKSLLDCGLPPGVFTNNVGVLNGTHVHIINKAEPEERAGFKDRKAIAALAEGKVEETVKRQSGSIPYVTEILEGGRPWEGSGGIPDTKATKGNGKSTVTATAKTVPASKSNGAAALAAKASEATADEDLMAIAINVMTDVLGEKPEGYARLIFRSSVFKKVKASAGDEKAQAMLNTYFDTDENLNLILNELGYQVSGQKILPIS